MPWGRGPRAVFCFFQQEKDPWLLDAPVIGMVFSFLVGKALAISSELSGGLACPRGGPGVSEIWVH